MQTSKNTKIKIIAGIIVIALAGFGFWKFGKKDAVAPEQGSNSTSPITTTPSNTPATARKYKDGTYSADGNYVSPAGKEAVSVSINIKNNIVTDASFIGKATNPGSKKMQENFSAGFKQFVVGKSVDSISLTVVNGSSLTPKGFMDALSKIKTQAQS